MPCHAAMEDKALIISETDTVEKTLKDMKKKKVSAALLVDEQGVYAGLFSLPVLFDNLLPVQVHMAGGSDMTLAAAPGIAKRLLKAKALPVSQFAARKASAVHPQTPLWEGIKLLSENHCMPLVVLDEATAKPLGIVTQESVLAELERMQSE